MLEYLVLEQISRASEVVAAPAPSQIVAERTATRPVTAQCFFAEAARQQIEPLKLLAVMKTEGGRVGQFVRNSNGTYDIGPMQINSVHLADLSKRLGASREEVASALAYDGCFNVAIGAWMLRKRTDEAGGDFWYGIGFYHSKTPTYRNRYILSVHKNMQDIVNRLNTQPRMSMNQREGY